jgi:hypothetical protein
MSDEYGNDLSTSEGYAAHVNAEAEKRREQVKFEQDMLKRKWEEEDKQRAQAQVMQEKMRKQKEDNLFSELTEGMDKNQIVALKEMYRLEPLIAGSSGRQRELYQREFDQWKKELTEKGRIVDRTAFRREDIYIATTGHGFIWRGVFHLGDPMLPQTTSARLQQIPLRDNKWFLTYTSHVPRTNFDILDLVSIEILPDEASNEQLIQKFKDIKKELKKRGIDVKD